MEFFLTRKSTKCYSWTTHHVCSVQMYVNTECYIVCPECRGKWAKVYIKTNNILWYRRIQESSLCGHTAFVVSALHPDTCLGRILYCVRHIGGQPSRARPQPAGGQGWARRHGPLFPASSGPWGAALTRQIPHQT